MRGSCVTVVVEVGSPYRLKNREFGEELGLLGPRFKKFGSPKVRLLRSSGGPGPGGILRPGVIRLRAIDQALWLD